MNQIMVIGGVTYDELIYLDQFPQPRPHTLFSKRYHQAIGGTGAGKALNLHRLGHDVLLHGLIGEDDAGCAILARFAAEGLSFAAEIDPAGTERHINLMNDAGDRISIYAQSATFEPDVDIQALEREVMNSNIIVLNIINYCRHIIPLAKKHNKPLWVDIHDYDGESPYQQDFINAADFLFMSSDQMPDYRNFMQRMLDGGKQCVVCTHGKAGATLLTDNDDVTIPILPAEVVDTNGAGDSFFSGFLHAYLMGASAMTAMQYATIVANLCVSSTELYSERLHPELITELHNTWYAI